MSTKIIKYYAICLALLLIPVSASAQTTAFTYQGKLTDAGNPANGTYDMLFKLFNTPTVGTGTQQGSTITNPSVQVADGIFTVTLDFGANVFDGAARYLEIAVRPVGNPNPHTILSPRQAITSSPYAIQTVNAQQLAGLPATRYVATNANGNAAIGAGTPAHRLALLGGPCWTGDCWGGALELENSSAIAWRQNTSGVKFGIGRTENGLFFFRTNSPLGTTTNGATYDFKMDNGGNVGIGNLGIGTDLSGARLTLGTSLGYGMVQTDGTVSVGSYIGGTIGYFGTRSNHRLGFFTNDGSARMLIDTVGNVGIGTMNPTARLQVDTGSSVGILANSQSNSIIGLSSAAGFAAVYGENTSGSSGFGVYGKGTTGYAMFADGNAGQSRDRGGFVKAMVYVNGDGTILRCYNGITGSSTGNCGFSAGKILGESGYYSVDFNFQVSDRFYSVSVEDDGFLDQAGISYTPSANNDALLVFTFDINAGRGDRPFMIIVY